MCERRCLLEVGYRLLQVPLELEDHPSIHIGKSKIWLSLDRTLDILKCARVVAHVSIDPTDFDQRLDPEWVQLVSPLPLREGLAVPSHHVTEIANLARHP